MAARDPDRLENALSHAHEAGGRVEMELEMTGNQGSNDFSNCNCKHSSFKVSNRVFSMKFDTLECSICCGVTDGRGPKSNDLFKFLS